MNSTCEADLRAARYPTYREAGVEWLGNVPEHWGVVPLKRIGWFCSGAGFPISAQGNRGGEILFAKVSDMNRSGNSREINRTANYVSREIARGLRAHIFPPDTIVFPKVGGALLTNKRRILMHETCIDNNLMGCVVTSAQTEFVFRLLRWLDLGALAKPGPVPAIGEREVGEIRVPLPPLPEQRAIVRFLDHADRRIRRYIRAKERLIELLEEERQATIHEAVTGQIDVRTGQPYPAYKDSSVEWLGKVPEDWEVSRLGRLLKLAVGFPFKSEGFTQSDDDIRLLRGVNIAPGRLRWDSVVRWPVEDADSFAEYRMQVGDIVLGMDRPIIQGGTRVAVVSESDVPSLLLQRVARVRVGESLIRDFAMALLGGKGFSDYLAPIFTGISVPHLSPEQIKGFQFALPSVVEQKAINEHVKSATYATQSAIAATLTQVQLLEEYRTRLIADVVTGKLDVHEAEASLPEVDPLGSDDTRRNPETTPAANSEALDPAFQ